MARKLIIACLLCMWAAPLAAQEQYFAIRVVDQQTGRGVPLVELRTVHGIAVYTDSGGMVAFYEPGLMNRKVFFHVQSHGYEFAEDGFGFRGQALHTKPGTTATLQIRRINLAERLYRITGAGIYRDSVLVGEPLPIGEPLLDAQVLGSDSVVNSRYEGRLYWFWGDTNRADYPLGNFHVPGATSQLPRPAGPDPALGVNLDYFVDDSGFAKETAKMPGQGPTWIGGLLTLVDNDRRERMFAGYAKINPPLDVYERGLVEWNNERNEFEHVVTFPPDAPLFPQGHTFRRQVEGEDYIYFANPYPLIRVRARVEDLRDSSRYEAYTCLEQRSQLDTAKIERDSQGRPRYAWKADTPAIDAQQQRRLIQQESLKGHERLLRLRDMESGKEVFAHSGSVYFNAYRGRWVLIAVELGGTSLLGEVWYAEAETPLGPWAYATKIVTHDDYSFYNPKQHPEFDQEEGRVIYFEGTYTQAFSGNEHPTPRYDYNQIMYRLDLSDPRTSLPVAFSSSADELPSKLSGSDHHLPWDRIAFFALDRAGVGTVPVYLGKDAHGQQRLMVGSDASQSSSVVFHALPAAARPLPEAAVALWEFHHIETGAFGYSLESDAPSADLSRSESPLCYVWSP